MSQTQKDYAKLQEISKEIATLKGIRSLLEWDQETYMPSAAAGSRSEQLKSLAGIIHKESTGRKFANALNKLIDISSGNILAADLKLEQQAALKEWRRDYHRDTSIPSKFVKDFAKLQSQAIVAWRSAKKEGAFLLFAPFLDRIVAMNRKKAEYLGYKEHPYDALLNEYEPDMTTKEVAHLFNKLQNFITPFLKKLTAKKIEDGFLYGEFDHSKQMTFSFKILEAMGYDMDKGRVDFSAHPFSTSSHPTDCRITTRIHPESLMSNIMVILHEAGHALYEMGLPPEQFGTPLGESRSLGIHESQSRWWETRIGLSEAFWKHYYPILKETYLKQLGKVTEEEFYRGINKIEPSFIRVEADEVTYPLHVALRFEIEKGLIEGSIKVRDIPEIWNAKMQEYLGITPKNNSEGCLQDIHWSMGAFGYFPTYTLGNLYAAHLFEAFSKGHPDWAEQVAKGEMGFIKNWLQEKVYRHGRRYTTQELLKQATGKPFTEDAYLNYIEDKYTKIYHL